MANHEGHTPIHYATYRANVIALEIIKDHLASLGQDLDPNFTGPGASPPLHQIGQFWGNLLFKEEDEPHICAVLKQNTAKTYALMRNLGGCFVWEREGAMIGYVSASFPYMSSCINVLQHDESCAEQIE